MNCNPMITQNNITQNRRSGGTFPDIDYSGCVASLPDDLLNVYDSIARSTPPAAGNYNVTKNGATILP
ncbi:MAG: hypothetical protein MZV63_55765 [Marinilabiliales bacterium]|nr:hypothetical protein [Marinilabiliales bacterium]